MPTMDAQLLHELYGQVIEASTTLGVDSGLRSRWRNSKAALPTPAPIGSWGQIQEWYEEFDDQADRHRHISHLYGAGPGKSLNLDDPTIKEAVRTTLESRSSGQTGWGNAIRAYVWTHMKEPESAMEFLSYTVRGARGNLSTPASGYMQLDAHFGAAAVLVNC